MLLFAADHNFNNHILRSVRSSNPAIDLVRLVDVGLEQTADDKVLAWAAEQGRILLTHDVATMPRYAYDRIQSGLAMPGLIVIRQRAEGRQVIEEILLMAERTESQPFEGQVIYLPRLVAR